MRTDVAASVRGRLLNVARETGEEYRVLVPEYVKDYVSLNQFAA